MRYNSDGELLVSGDGGGGGGGDGNSVPQIDWFEGRQTFGNPFPVDTKFYRTEVFDPTGASASVVWKDFDGNIVASPTEGQVAHIAESNDEVLSNIDSELDTVSSQTMAIQDTLGLIAGVSNTPSTDFNNDDSTIAELIRGLGLILQGSEATIVTSGETLSAVGAGTVINLSAFQVPVTCSFFYTADVDVGGGGFATLVIEHSLDGLTGWRSVTEEITYNTDGTGEIRFSAKPYAYLRVNILNSSGIFSFDYDFRGMRGV